MRRVPSPSTSRHAHALRCLLGVEPARREVGPIARLRLGGLSAQLRLLQSGHRQRQATTLDHVGVYVLARHGGGDVVDSLNERAMHPSGGVQAVLADHAVPRHGKEVAAPATVAPARPEPGNLALEQHDPQARIPLHQGIRGPQARVPGAHDGDIDLAVAVEGWSR